jgi:hypothetical protein
MSSYFPRPNPPFQPKECQECGELIDGEETEGWWLEHRSDYGEQYHLLMCIQCTCDRMHMLPHYPDVMNVSEAKKYLYKDNL